jgi:hypothetical protein
MGWNFRRGFSLGPFRINLSKKGVGASIGVGGVRVGHDARGRNYSQVSIPGTGIYRRDYYKTNSTTPGAGSSPAQVTQPSQTQGQPSPLPQTITTSGKYLICLIALAILLSIVLHLVFK